MGFIAEARMMLDAAEKAAGSQATRVGWLTLAKDTISAALTESKKGVKGQDGHIVGQTSLDDFAGAPIGAEAKVNGSGVVLTPADERIDPGDQPEDDGEDDDEPAYDEVQMEEHKRHVAESPGIYQEDCPLCLLVAGLSASGGPEHGRPDTSEDIPRIGDSRGIPDGDGAQVAG